MSGSTTYILVSLPTSISPSNDKDGAFAALQSTVSTDNGTVLPFKIPEFKIGTLDALVQQADDLAKLDSTCEAIVAKMGDSLHSLLDGDRERTAQQKTVNDSTCKESTQEVILPPPLLTYMMQQSHRINTYGRLRGTKSSIVPTNHWQSLSTRCKRLSPPQMIV